MIIFRKKFQIFFENPKLTNTAQSQQKSFPKIQKCLTLGNSDSAQANTAQSFAGNNFVFAGLALPWKRIPNLKKIHVNYLLQHCPTFFVSFFKELACQNILTPRSVSLMKSNFSNLKFWKQIFKQNYFSMFIRGPDGFDSWNKKDNKISWHCPFKLNLKNIVQHFYWPRTFQLPRN